MALSDGLTSFFEYNEPSGSRVDRVGPYTLSLTAGGVGVATGHVYANAAALRTATDGLMIASASVPAAYNPPTGAGTAWSWVGWVNPHAWSDAFNHYFGIMCHGGYAFGGYEIEVTYNNRIAFLVYTTFAYGGNAAQATHAVLGNTGNDGLDQWNLVAFWEDPVANVIGSLALPYNTPDDPAAWSLGMEACDDNLIVGTDIRGDTPNYDLGPSMTYNRVISGAEITDLWNGGVGLTFEDMMGGAAGPIPDRLVRLPQAVKRAAYW